MDLCIWIRELEADQPGIWRLKGIAFDGDMGFGNEFIRDYSGNLVLVTLESRSIICNIEIDTYHRLFEGFGWLATVESLPDPPFLITNQMNIKLIFNGLVDLETTEDAIELFASHKKGYSYAVKGDNDWFGILSYNGSCDSHLIAFSDADEKVKLKGSQVLWAEHSSNWCIGQITQSKNRMKMRVS